MAASSSSADEHDLVRAAEVVGQREDRRAVQRAQLRPRTLLEQALEALCGRLVAAASAVRRIREVPALEQLPERGLGGRVVRVLHEQLVERRRRAAGPGALLRPRRSRREPCRAAPLRRARPPCADAGGFAVREQRPPAERHERQRGRDRTDRGPAQPGRGDRAAVDLGRRLADVRRRRHDGPRA